MNLDETPEQAAARVPGVTVEQAREVLEYERRFAAQADLRKAMELVRRAPLRHHLYLHHPKCTDKRPVFHMRCPI